MVCSFGAGFVALKLLSSLLEAGRWKFFGFYCLLASAGVFALAYVDGQAAVEPPPVPLHTTDTASPTAPAAPTLPAPESGPAPTNEAPLPNLSGPPSSWVPASMQQPTNAAPADGATNAAPTSNPAPSTNAESAPMAPGTTAGQ
jgi:hypothetical protein